MDLGKWFRKTPQKVVEGWKGFVSTFGVSPPERNLRGYLSAYGEIYSLFGVALRIANAVSEVRWRLYKGSQRSERSQIADHPILDLMDYANEFQTGQEIIELTQLDLDLAGRAYWYLPRNQLGAPAEIWVIPPHLIQIVPSQKEFIAGYIYLAGSERVALSKEQVIRFAMPDPLNPYGGIGYIQPTAVELDSEIYAGRWNRNFFYNSARHDLALEIDDYLTKEQRDPILEQWASGHQGLARAHKVALLEGGMKAKILQSTQKDMDFLQLRKQARENVMFTFGMPLSVMGIVENVNRANAEAGEYCFARWLVKPRLTRIKNKLNEQLVTMFGKSQNLELDFDEVVPETIEQKKSLAESGVRSGWMTVNEARKLNGFDPLPDDKGNQLLIPMNIFPTPIKSFSYPSLHKHKGLSNEQKLAMWQQYVAKTEREETLFKKTLKNLFNEQENTVIQSLTLSTFEFDEESESRKFRDSFKPVITEVFTSHYQDIVEGSKTVKQNEFLNQAALEWIASRSLTMAQLVNGTTREELRAALAEGFKAGEGISQLTKRIKDYYRDGYERRASMVARTETIAASAEGSIIGYRDLGVIRLEFYPSVDACEECLAEIGEYNIEETSGIIPVHPNCRCKFLPVI